MTPDECAAFAAGVAAERARVLAILDRRAALEAERADAAELRGDDESRREHDEAGAALRLAHFAIRQGG